MAATTAFTIIRFLLISAVAVWPAAGLHILRNQGFDSPMPPLFPEGRVPGPQIDRDPLHSVEMFGAYVHEPDVEALKHTCHVNGTLTDLYLHVTTPGLMSFALEKPSSRAAVLVVPGGGHSFVAWEGEGTQIAEWLNTLGISAFVLKYRVPSQMHMSINNADVERAMSTVRSRADELGFDADRIGVIGFSAGGDMATRVSDSSSKRSYERIDEIDDVPFKANFQLLIYGVAGSPFSAVHDPPPTFIAHAVDDPCAPQELTEAYCLKMKLKNKSCTRFLYENGGHGIGVCNGQWEYGVPHTHRERGYNNTDAFYNTWSGDAFCAWTGEAKKWLQEISIIRT